MHVQHQYLAGIHQVSRTSGSGSYPVPFEKAGASGSEAAAPIRAFPLLVIEMGGKLNTIVF